MFSGPKKDLCGPKIQTDNGLNRWILSSTAAWGAGLLHENNGYTYNWHVKHDFNGLITLMGGPAKAEANLDQLFRETRACQTLSSRRNFPIPRPWWASFPWAMNQAWGFRIYSSFSERLGKPRSAFGCCSNRFSPIPSWHPGRRRWRGAERIRGLLDDGLLPVTPGIPTYDIGSPVFDKVTIHLKNGKDFSIIARNNSHDNKYVQDIRLNGQTISRVWFRHADIANGGTLELTMADTPNTSLGTKPIHLPTRIHQTPTPRTIDKSNLLQPKGFCRLAMDFGEQ